MMQLRWSASVPKVESRELLKDRAQNGTTPIEAPITNRYFQPPHLLLSMDSSNSYS